MHNNVKTGVSNIFSYAKSMEGFSGAHANWSRLYYRILYQKYLQWETTAVAITPGMRVLHVGCGPLPFTAVHLANAGCSVVATDNDPAAVVKAKNYLAKEGLEKVETMLLDGLETRAEDFDAVWVSVQVRPKRQILRQIWQTLPANGCLVYRNPGWFVRQFYPSSMCVPPLTIASTSFSLRQEGTIWKESVILRKGSDHERVMPRLQTLAELPVGSGGVLVSIPEHGLLSPLGLRMGKRVEVTAKQWFGGPIMVSVQGRQLAVARRLAAEIGVERRDPLD